MDKAKHWPQERLRCPRTQPMVMDGHDILRIRAEDYPEYPATEPCPFPPGSPERIQAMQDRVRRCEALYHPDDCNDYSGVRAVQYHRKGSKHHVFGIIVVDEIVYRGDDDEI